MATFLLYGVTTSSLPAGSFERISVPDVSQSPSPGGAGDSFCPVASSDGRYVLFASAANNLIINSNYNHFTPQNPPRLNVFLRDRASNTTALVSVNSTGLGGGDADSLPVQISSDGRYALFESAADNLVENDTNGVNDVFLRDLVNGLTFLVSTNPTGGVGNGTSRNSTMTPDGHLVVFVSSATNLVVGDTNGIPDVFIRDIQAGTTALVSQGAMTTNHFDFSGGSGNPEITPDGRYVAFFSTATNLVPGITKAGDIYIRDLAASTTIWASTNARALLGTQNAISYNEAISDDGEFVVFETSTNNIPGSAYRGIILRYNVTTQTTDLVNTNATVPYGPYEELRTLAMTPDGRFIAFLANTNDPSGSTNSVYLWDGQSGTTTLISVDLNTNVPAGICDWPLVDTSGHYVTFLSSATNIVTNALVGEYHLYIRDVQAGTTRLLATDVNGNGSAVSPATLPVFSPTGTFVIFEAPDTSLLASNRSSDYDVFFRDLAGTSTEVISSHDPALPSSSPDGPDMLLDGSASSDGRFIAFSTEADNLIGLDTNSCRDVFVRDRILQTNILVSAATNGLPGNFASTGGSLTPGGRFVVFSSLANNLVPGDAKTNQDVFIRDLNSSNTTLVSVNSTGTASGNGDSYSPVVSSDGRFIMFRSKATDLAPGSYSPYSENLFLRDLALSSTFALTTTGVLYSAMSADGHFVAFANTAQIYLWDSLASTLIYTNSVTNTAGLGLSKDGNHLVYWAGSGPFTLIALDRTSGSNSVITTGYPPSKPGFQFSASGRWMTYLAKPSPTDPTQVYLFDFEAQTSSLVSRHLNTLASVNSNCDSPAIGVDGRFVVYRSTATDIDPESTNGIPQLFLFDQLASTTTLVTANRFATGSADRLSLSATFSRDGKTLLFESWASDLDPSDFNHTSDLFVYPLFYLTITQGASGTSLRWPAVLGATYRVQYKNDLSDPDWHEAAGNVTVTGTHAFFSDAAVSATQRFYRVITF